MKHTKLKVLMVLAAAFMAIPIVAEVQARSVHVKVEVTLLGQPVKGATVQVYTMVSGLPQLLRQGTTNKQGIARFRCLPLWLVIDVEVTYMGLITWARGIELYDYRVSLQVPVD